MSLLELFMQDEETPAGRTGRRFPIIFPREEPFPTLFLR
jgi:hypothetical protein